jgi:DNA polymerase-3 subunit alpha
MTDHNTATNASKTSAADKRSRIGASTSDFRQLYHWLPRTELPKTMAEIARQRDHIDINIDRIPLNDEETFQLFQCGDTTNVLPFNTPRAVAALRRLKPLCLEDLTTVLCLSIRYKNKVTVQVPKMVQKALRNIHKQDDCDVLYAESAIENMGTYLGHMLPPIRAILKETGGFICYNDQIIQIIMIMAGFSQEEANSFYEVIASSTPNEPALDEQRRFFAIARLK